MQLVRGYTPAHRVWHLRLPGVSTSSRTGTTGWLYERSQDFIDAEVVRLVTNHRLTPDTDIPQLIHTELRRVLMEDSGLDQVRPDIDLSFSNPAGYLELLDYIKSYGWDLAVQLDQLPTRSRVAGEWLAAIFDPGMEAIASATVDFRQAEVTQGDVFLWLYQRRRLLCASGGACGFNQTVHEALDHRGKLPRELRRALHRQAALVLR